MEDAWTHVINHMDLKDLRRFRLVCRFFYGISLRILHQSYILFRILSVRPHQDGYDDRGGIIMSDRIDMQEIKKMVSQKANFPPHRYTIARAPTECLAYIISSNQPDLYTDNLYFHWIVMRDRHIPIGRYLGYAGDDKETDPIPIRERSRRIVYTLFLRKRKRS